MSRNKYRIRNHNLIVRATPLAGFTSAIINTTIFVAGTLTGLISPQVLILGEPLNSLEVIFFSICTGILAGIWLLALGKISRRWAWEAFQISLGVGFIVLITNPFLYGPTIPFGMSLILILMHLVPFTLIFLFFQRQAIARAV
ncbi:MAG TPA: DUF6069 family protein [Catalimonadaceae bacterium]|nr:DUF6069 family protein [Catalimonadaceae bacterium]HPI12559.1 DUF6069 family protein [Catalimonadaceae bacterium]